MSLVAELTFIFVLTLVFQGNLGLFLTILPASSYHPGPKSLSHVNVYYGNTQVPDTKCFSFPFICNKLPQT